MTTDGDVTSPPPLPPRRPLPVLAPEEELDVSSNMPSLFQTPPPLPPRTAPAARTVPQPIVTNPLPETPTPIPEAQQAPRVDVTPATPPQQMSPVSTSSINLPSVGQTAEAIRSAPLPNTGSTPGHPGVAAPSKPVPPLPPRPPPKLETPPMNKPQSTSTVLNNVTWVEWLLIAALGLNYLAVGPSPFWFIIIAVAYILMELKKPSGIFSAAPQLNESTENQPRPGQGNEAVAWVNHALYALFPLISTDVLTPSLDLLEDALMQQVPPIVTSVRLTSAALGSQPMLLNSLRPLTDEEWFASLAPLAKPKLQPDSSKGSHTQTNLHRRSEPSATKPLSPSTKTHLRNVSAPIGSKLSRTPSASSVGSALNEEDIAKDTHRRRQRDRILAKVSRRHRAIANEAQSSPGTPSTLSSPDETLGVDNEVEAYEDTGADEDEDSVGHFVNYQVGFEYKRTEMTKKKGWGLHVLAYFGWGVKGVGKSEIPVYIDVIAIKGTLNLRLLLSATPPFVRNATFSFPSLPEFDISAVPLRKGAFNAMELPGMKSYVQSSFQKVAGAFVRPESFALDVDRLLLGRESALRTHTVGVLHIIIHSAEDLPKTDTMGSCDPYVAISFSKFHKPLFSTRTINDTRSPSWEEPAFILVSADAIESGERLRLRMVDADRFSADDAMGAVEVELAELADTSGTTHPDDPPHRRVDPLKADRPGMRASGSLEWSVRFCPLWGIPPDQVQKRVEEMAKERIGEPTAADRNLPWWLEWMNQWMDVPDWEGERAKRRQETLAWFTGERERDGMEAALRPPEDLRSGILQFHIHQCTDLEVESLEGTYSSALNSRLSAAAGKPALADVVDRTPAENPDPPSAYVEVHLNDRLVYRTRTKQLTPLPYFNAVSERFIRDWHLAKIVFVVRDERDREHDPILGIVSVRLKDVFTDRSHFTRWFPLVGGLGWGRIRLSLLFKPVNMKLPPRVSGYETATLEVKSLSATDMSRYTHRAVNVMIQTETDTFTLKKPGDDDADRSRLSIDGPLSPNAPFTPRSVDVDDMTEVEWEIDRPIRLAVEYRHSCSVVVSFVTRSKMVKKKRVLGLATIRLDEIPDGEECRRTVPIFDTGEVKEAVRASAFYRQTHSQEGEGDQEGQITPTAPPPMDDTPMVVGFVSMSMVLFPGISRAHKKLCKRDLRLKRVYEAWEAAKEVDARWDKRKAGDVVRATKARVLDGEGDEEGNDVSESESSENDEDGVEGGNGERDGDGSVVEGTRKRESGTSQSTSVDDFREDGLFADKRAHAHALHKRNKGIFQLKIARTGKLVKDKLEAKMYAAGQERRQRGQDLDVEHEGQSR